MRFVEHEIVVFGNDLAVGSLPHHQVREEQVVVHDDELALRRLLPEPGHVAAVEVGAFLAHAVLAPRRDPFPEIELLGDAGNLGAIPGLRHLAPELKGLEVRGLLEETKRRLRLELGEPGEAQVVPAAFHETGGERQVEGLPHQRDVLVEELLLEVLGPRRDDDPLPGEDGGDQIGERLPRPGSRFDQELATLAQHVGHGGGHVLLGLAMLEARKSGGEGAARAEDLPDPLGVEGVETPLGPVEALASRHLRLRPCRTKSGLAFLRGLRGLRGLRYLRPAHPCAIKLG